MLSYALKDLWRNPRRTVASVAGIALAVGLLTGIALFVDSSTSRMTRRVVTPVTLDMQAGLNAPLASSLSVTESITPKLPAAPGHRVQVSITVRNTASTPATGVVLQETLPPLFAYLPGSSTRGQAPVSDVPPAEGELVSSSPIVGGLALGTLAPGATSTVGYAATTTAAVPATLELGATAKSVEDPAPTSATSPKAVNLDQLSAAIRRIPGVRTAQPFALVGLPAGSLRVGATTLASPVTIIALDPTYLHDFGLVRLTSGVFMPGTAFVSLPASQQLGAAPGATLTLTTPGRVAPLPLRLGAVADLSSADALFASRNPDSLGDFAAAPYVIGVDVATFRSAILPALRVDAAAAVPTLKNPPVIETHVALRRATLDTDPGHAFVTTRGLRRSIERLSTGDVTVIDNLSDALHRAGRDSTLAKIMFIILGLPGVLLAGYLSQYAAGLLADAQRRERAMLRARGFSSNALTRSLGYHALVVTLLASAFGIALGIAGAAIAFPSDFAPSTAAYLVSCGLAVLGAALTTTLAMYLPGRRALRREIVEERRTLDRRDRPPWVRGRVDLVLLAGALVVGIVYSLTGGLKPTADVESQSVAQAFYVMLAPLLFWVGAILLVARLMLRAAHRLSGAVAVAQFRRRRTTKLLLLSVIRRPAAVASGVITVSLAVAFGISLAVFVSTYRVEQRADARFALGGDVRVTAGGAQAVPPDFADRLRVPGVRTVSPVALEPGALVGTDKVVAVGVDAASLRQVAPFDADFFTDTTPARALATLTHRPDAALVDQQTAQTFNLHAGDTITVQVPTRATAKPAAIPLHLVGTFVHFPAFPSGVDFVTSLTTYEAAVGRVNPDFYLLRTDGTPSTNARVVAALRATVGRTAALRVQTTAQATNKDQTTLAALNLNGLDRLERSYALVISALGVTVFALGLLLRRRKEYVTVRAFGAPVRQLRALVLGEAGLVAGLSLLLGSAVGLAMAAMFVQILRRIFIIPPSRLHIPTLGVVAFLALVGAAATLASFAATATLRQLRLVEILRED